jgi:hypothetical protein
MGRLKSKNMKSKKNLRNSKTISTNARKFSYRLSMSFFLAAKMLNTTLSSYNDGKLVTC